MSGIRSLFRGPVVKGVATDSSVPIYVDSDDNILKIIPAGSGTTEVQQIDASSVQTMTNKTLTSPVITNPTQSGQTPATITGATATLGAAHVGRTTTLNRAAGIALTLPAATGSGDIYELLVLATFTGASSVAVANASDYMIGVAQMGIDGGTAVPHQYPTANTGTVATESDTCSLFGTANSQGGIKGARIKLQDIAANIWSVLYTSDAGGTEATPFSAAV
jgi:hypothetical protein